MAEGRERAMEGSRRERESAAGRGSEIVRVRGCGRVFSKIVSRGLFVNITAISNFSFFALNLSLI